MNCYLPADDAARFDVRHVKRRLPETGGLVTQPVKVAATTPAFRGLLRRGPPRTGIVSQLSGGQGGSRVAGRLV